MLIGVLFVFRIRSIDRLFVRSLARSFVSWLVLLSVRECSLTRARAIHMLHTYIACICMRLSRTISGRSFHSFDNNGIHIRTQFHT